MTLISKESLLKKFESGALYFQDKVREIIQKMPEGVIRCRNCEYRYDEFLCPIECEDSWYSHDYGDDFFCKFGERKKDDATD